MNYRHKPSVDRRNIPRTATEMQEYLKKTRINSTLPDYVITGEELLNLQTM